MKKLALFDIDGVIYDGHFIFDQIKGQDESGFIEHGSWNLILALLEKYKKGKMSYKEAADNMLLDYANKLAGKKYVDLVQKSLDLIESNKSNFFPYFAETVERLKTIYDIYFVTTNFDFAAEALTRYFGVKDFLSSKVNQENGIVLPGIGLSLGGNKGIVTDLISKYGKIGSFAVGDSENDSDMLEKVEFPFVIEPDDKLAKIAADKNWQVVTRDTIQEKLLSLI